MRILKEPRLVPVVELPPYRFLDHLEYPDGDLDEQECVAYWRASLASSGFEAMEPVWPGSYFVTVDQFHGGSLDAIIKYELAHCDVKDGGLPLSLDGGYFLNDGESEEADPQCCARLKDLADWEVSVSDDEVSEHWIGIGHPGLSVTREGENLRFESAGPEKEHITPFLCSVAALRSQVEKARQTVLDFRARLEERSRLLVGPRAAEFCDGLVGRLSEAHDDGWV